MTPDDEVNAANEDAGIPPRPQIKFGEPTRSFLPARVPDAQEAFVLDTLGEHLTRMSATVQLMHTCGPACQVDDETHRMLQELRAKLEACRRTLGWLRALDS